MLLSDKTIRSRISSPESWQHWQWIEVEPFDDAALQACSIDVHLGDRLKVYTGAACDTRRDNSPWWETLVLSDWPSGAAGWKLQPGRFYLAVLAERIRIPEDCCGQLAGVSSLARDGVTPHQQAGLLDPGWDGWATLELTVESPNTILYPGQRIAQVTFSLLDQRCQRPYRGRYQHDRGPQPAKPDREVAA